MSSDPWCTAMPDWEERILAGKSLVPTLPLFEAEADFALRIFKKLKLTDVVGQPTLGDAGLPWLFDFVSAVFGSYDPETAVRQLQEFFMLISKKNSKAVHLRTEIATPIGFTTMGDLRPGDVIFDADGKLTHVTAKSEVFYDRECYEVEFSTGEMVVCDAEHLWVTDSHVDRGRQKGDRKTPCPSAKTTKEIAAKVTVASGHYTITNHRTALCGALQLPDADLSIPPYALGVWLGNGATQQAIVTTGLDDADGVNASLNACGQTAYIRQRFAGENGRQGSAIIALCDPADGSRRIPYRFATEAKRLGVIGNKHIPQTYLRASINQRLALLQGLMDTDGCISLVGQATYSTITPALRDGVCELICSLGWKASFSEHRAILNGVDHGPYWVIQYWPFAGAPVSQMERKSRRQKPHPGRPTRSTTRQIVAVRPVSSVPTQCITVDSPTSQFLVTRSLIPTHNSTSAAAVMITALLRNRRSNGEYLIVSPTKSIADNSYNPAAAMIRADPHLSKRFHIQDNFRRITDRNTDAFLQVKAADTQVIGGQKATGILVDELWLFGQMARGENVMSEITGSLAARPDGFVIYLTTQSDIPPAGVFRKKLIHHREVRDGKRQDPRAFQVIYEHPDALLKNELWMEERYFHITNPNLDRSVSRSFLRAELAKAREDGIDSLSLFAAKHFNIEIGIALKSGHWIGAEYWDKAAEPGLTLDALIERSEVITIGVDGGGADDLLGLAVVGRERDTRRWLHWAHAWAHPIALERRKSNKPEYDRLAKAGELTVIEDYPEDLLGVVEIVQRIREAGLLAAVGMDRIGLDQAVDAFAEIGLNEDDKTLYGVPQGYVLTGAIKSLERKLIDGSFVHGGQHLMRWCVGNAKVEATKNAFLITKQASGTAKIDPLMATFDAAYLMGRNPDVHRIPEYQVIFA